MKYLLRISALALFAVVGAFAAASLASPVTTFAQDQGQPTDTNQTEEQNTDNAESAYSYVAQPGDSYTKIARKAVQTYGIIENVNLSQAGIVFAETHLTLDAGSPLLNIGQAVEIQKSDLEAVVERARDLSESQQKAWEFYVKFVDFNTDNVGQVRE